MLVTAGYVNEAPLRDLLPFIDAVNIDLKSFSDEVYRKVSRVRLQPILDTLLAMRNAGVWIEITRLLIPGISDGEEDIRAMCHWLMEHGFADIAGHRCHSLIGFALCPADGARRRHALCVYRQYFVDGCRKHLLPEVRKFAGQARRVCRLFRKLFGYMSGMWGGYCRCMDVLMHRNAGKVLAENVIIPIFARIYH